MRKLKQKLFSILFFLKDLLAFVARINYFFKSNILYGVPLLFFIFFLFVQLAILLLGIFNQSYLMISRALLVILTLGAIVFLTFSYRKNRNRYGGITLEDILEQLPGHIYWKSKDGVCLGSNKQNWHDFGVETIDDYVGKTDYDLFPEEEADKLREADEEVMNSDRLHILEELSTGREQALYLSHKVPLKDHSNKTIGIIGTSVDITQSKRETLDKLKVLENIISIMPGNVYWMDRDMVYLGCNENQAEFIGLASRDEIIGKRNSDIQDLSISRVLDKINNEVISSGETITTEEPAILKDGSQAVFLSTKSPLYNYNKDIVGIVGVSINITHHKKIEKEAEQLKLKNELQELKLQEQDKFRMIAEQVAHDIRSPLASLSMIVGSCKDIHEPDRVTLREVASGISDIANNLLTRYKSKDFEEADRLGISRDVLVSLAVLELVSEKRYQYKNMPIKFNYLFDAESSFVSINTDPSSFNRMLSNVVNNAVESFEGKEGVVDLTLDLYDDHINVVVKDNGKGMPDDVINKIMDNVLVTYGKQGGTGIGYTQVQSALKSCQGKMQIKSDIGEGTEVTLVFPRGNTLDWLTKEINLNSGDTIVILDDDLSIHGAWEKRFEEYKSDLNLLHFKYGNEALEFIDGLTLEEKNKTFLLSDFELIGEEYNGLQVIAKTAMESRSALVTSHYANAVLTDAACKFGVKILPKQLASYVAVNIKNKQQGSINKFNDADVVVVDDSEMFADSMASLLRTKSITVDVYHKPQEFLDRLSDYPKETTIIMDNDFKSKVTGFDLAERLNKLGYTKLFMFSGSNFDPDIVPDYLTLMLKGDADSIDVLIDSVKRNLRREQ